MSNKLGGSMRGSAYLGTNAVQPPDCTFTNVAPTQYDTNYSLLDLWLNTETQIAYVLVSLAGNSMSAGPLATWIPLNGAGGGAITEVMGNSGIPVLANGLGEILIFGGANINTVGTTNTLTVNLNDSIVLPATTTDQSEGVLTIGTTTALQMFGSGNIFLGGAGNFTLTGSNNTCAGSASGEDLTTGNNNSLYGAGSGQSLLTGNNNVIIGFGSGSDFDNDESNNICLGNLGVPGDDNTMRLGTSGSGPRQIDTTHIAGVFSNILTLGTNNGVVIVDNTDLMRMTRGTDGQILIGADGSVGPEWANLTSMGGSIIITNGANSINLESVSSGAISCAFLLQNTPNLINITGDGTVYQFGAGQALTKRFDVGTNCTTGNGTGTPATFTAPTTSQYYLEITIHLTNIDADGGNDAIIGTAHIVTTARTYTWDFSPSSFGGAGDGITEVTISFQQIVNMSSGDTATFSISTGTGNKVIGLGANSYISGYLVSGAAVGILTVNSDSGSITPVNNEINVLGGTNCSTIATGPNTLTINVTGSGGGGFVTWSVITSSQSGVAGNGYFCNGGSQVVVTLPSSSAVGDTIAVAAMNSNGFRISQPSGVSVQFTNTTTTIGTGGSLTSTAIGDSVILVCNVANTSWFAVPGSMGNITIV